MTRLYTKHKVRNVIDNLFYLFTASCIYSIQREPRIDLSDFTPHFAHGGSGLNELISMIACIVFTHFFQLQHLPSRIKICQSRFKVLRNTKNTLEFFQRLHSPKWRNFAKSGHTSLKVVGSNPPE